MYERNDKKNKKERIITVFRLFGVGFMNIIREKKTQRTVNNYNMILLENKNLKGTEVQYL